MIGVAGLALTLPVGMSSARASADFEQLGIGVSRIALLVRSVSAEVRFTRRDLRILDADARPIPSGSPKVEPLAR